MLCFLCLLLRHKIVNQRLESFKNTWTTAPINIPNNVSIDAPLMGNGDLTMTVGYKAGVLRFYLSKNDFWRLKSQSDNLSGPRVAAFLDISIEGFNDAEFNAEQSIQNGITTCRLNTNGQSIEVISMVSATDNQVIIQLKAIDKPATISINLTAPENAQSIQNKGKKDNINWLTRAFRDSVDIPSQVAVAFKTINHSDSFKLQPEKLSPLPLQWKAGSKQKSLRKSIEAGEETK